VAHESVTRAVTDEARGLPAVRNERPGATTRFFCDGRRANAQFVAKHAIRPAPFAFIMAVWVHATVCAAFHRSLGFALVDESV